MKKYLNSDEDELEIIAKSLIQCEICYESKLISEFTQLQGCDHEFCNVCLQNYTVSKLLTNRVLPLSCPNHDCKILDHPKLAELFLSDENKEKFQLLREYNQLQKNPNLR